MRAYWVFFKSKFMINLQYRMAAILGILTQFVWGYLLIVLYQMFSITEWSSRQIATYFWLNQAFLSLNTLWTMDMSIFQDIQRGDVQYDWIRPQSIYGKWFVSNLSHRLARTILRALPLLIVTLALPNPYRLLLPVSLGRSIGFFFALIGALLTQCAISNILYVIVLKVKQDLGVRVLSAAIFNLFDGGDIPYFYYPKSLARVLSYTFFYSIKTAPFLIYLGLLPVIPTLVLQAVWFVILVFVGMILLQRQMRTIEVYGG